MITEKEKSGFLSAPGTHWVFIGATATGKLWARANRTSELLRHKKPSPEQAGLNFASAETPKMTIGDVTPSSEL